MNAWTIGGRINWSKEFKVIKGNPENFKGYIITGLPKDESLEYRLARTDRFEKVRRDKQRKGAYA